MLERLRTCCMAVGDLTAFLVKFRTVHTKRADRTYGKVDIVDIVDVIDIVDVVDMYYLLIHYLLTHCSSTLLSILKMVYPLPLPLASSPPSLLSVPQ